MKIALVATIAMGTSGAMLAWRERPEPGAVPLTIFLAGQCWWSVTLFFRLNATGVGRKIFWVDLSWVGIVVIPVAWVFFALEYTGYSQYVQRRYVALLSVVPVVTALLGVTNQYHHLLYVDSALVERSGVMTVTRTPGIWHWVVAGYTYLLGLVGAVPLLQFVTSDVNSFRGQSLAILVGLFVPGVTNGLFLLGILPTGGIDPTPVAFSITGVTYLGALTQFKLFGTSPAPIRPARRSVFKRMQEGAIVLDRHDHVVDINQQAAAALGSAPEDVLGRPVEGVMPNHDTEPSGSASGRTIYRPDDGNRAYDLSVSVLTDAHDRTTGRIITLHDITDHLRQQQRLEVLNRVFRHNIRTNTQVIVGNADYLADHNSEQRAAKVRQNAQQIKDISDKIRTVLDVFKQGRTETQPVSLEETLEKSLRSARSEHPEVAFESDLDFGSDTVYVNSVLTDVFANVVDNAARHNTSEDPTVRIDVDAGDDHVTVTVTDNGPGIDDEELALVNHGTETDLEHGTGIGLALIVWGTEIAGGEVTFDENDPTGLSVTVDAPRLVPPETRSDAAEDAEQETGSRTGPQSLHALSTEFPL